MSWNIAVPANRNVRYQTAFYGNLRRCVACGNSDRPRKRRCS